MNGPWVRGARATRGKEATRPDGNPNKARRYEVVKRVESPNYGLNVGRFVFQVQLVETPMGKWAFVVLSRERTDTWHGESQPWKGKFTAPDDPNVLRWLGLQLLTESRQSERRIIAAAKASVTAEQVRAEPCQASSTRAGGQACNAKANEPCHGPKGGSLGQRYHAARWQACMAKHGKPIPAEAEKL